MPVDLDKLTELMARILPITTNDTPDYAKLYFGNHQTQAMTMDPATWLEIGEAIPFFLADLLALQAEADRMRGAGHKLALAAGRLIVATDSDARRPFNSVRPQRQAALDALKDWEAALATARKALEGGAGS